MTDYNWFQLQNGSDIRGVALEGIPGEKINFTPEIAETIAQAFAHWIKNEKKIEDPITISVGTDSRLSGPAIKEGVIKGLQTAGCQVLDFGMASTPAMFMSTIHPETDCQGAIMLTASHLPFNRNGMKFFSKEGGLEKGDIKTILTYAGEGIPSDNREPGRVSELDFISYYAGDLVEKIRKGVNSPINYQEPFKGLKILLDAGNGAGGFFASKVLEPLGADTKGSQFLNPDGHFPNHIPNPEDQEAMASISQAVLNNQADLGIIFDTDVDRAAIVDRQGQEINRNKLIALIGAIVLEEHPESTIVTDSITSDGLASFIASKNGVHHRFKRGYRNVINEAEKLNDQGQESWLAIETSGHAAMKENYFLDDGAYLVSKLLIKMGEMHQKGKGELTSLIQNLKEPLKSQEFRIKINDSDFKTVGQKVITELENLAQQTPGWKLVPNNYEGVRVSCKEGAGEGWFLLRLSLHDPVIPLNVESNISGGVDQIASKLHSFFRNFPELDLTPFE